MDFHTKRWVAATLFCVLLFHTLFFSIRYVSSLETPISQFENHDSSAFLTSPSLSSSKKKEKTYVSKNVRHLKKTVEKGASIRVILDVAKKQSSQLAKIKKQWKTSLKKTEKVNTFSNHFQRYEAITQQMRKQIYRYLQKTTKKIRNHVKTRVQDLGGRIVDEIITTNYIVADIPVSKFDLLQKTPSIQGIYADTRIHTNLDNAAPTINTSVWWENDYNGSNYQEEGAVEVAILDTGINSSHPALQGKVVDEKSFVEETVKDYNGHGTHVAGIVASTNPNYTGIGAGASLLNGKCIYKNDTGYLSDLMEAAEWSVINASDTAEIISTSLGVKDGTPDGASAITKFTDAFIDYYNVIWCTAAGNDGDIDGSESTDPPGDAYNAITVGATNDGNDPDRTNDFVASYSSRGPTVNGRIKPDVVAPGSDILSADAGYEEDGNWTSKSGTSMATPMVAGAAADIYPFLTSFYDFSSVSLSFKALLLNAAQDMGVSRNKQGFGYIDLGTMWKYRQFLASFNLTEGGEKGRWMSLKENESFSGMIVWKRHVDTYNRETSSFYTVSNLDIELQYPNGTVLARNNSTVGTVEQLYVPNIPKTGFYKLVVKGTSVSTEIVSEHVALSASHKLFSSPLQVSLTQSSQKIIDQPITIQANITNQGSEPLHNLSATLGLPQGIHITSETKIYTNSTLTPNTTWQLNWAIKTEIAGIFNYSLFINTSSIRDPLTTTKNLILTIEKEDLKIHLDNVQTVINTPTSLQINITNRGTVNISNITTQLEISQLITRINSEKLSQANFAVNHSWLPYWNMTSSHFGNFTFNLTITSPALSEPIQKTGFLFVSSTGKKLKVALEQISGTKTDTRTLHVNITNLAEDVLPLTVSLDLPSSVTLSNGSPIENISIPAQTTTTLEWTLRLQYQGTSRYTVTLQSPFLGNPISKQAEIAISRTFWQKLLDTIRHIPLGGWIGISIGIVVGIVVAGFTVYKLRKKPKPSRKKEAPEPEGEKKIVRRELEDRIIQLVKRGEVQTVSQIAEHLDRSKEEIRRIIDESDRIQLET